MYAVVAGGISTVVHTLAELDLITSIFPYPKVGKVNSDIEAREFIRKHARKFNSTDIDNYGNASKSKSIKVEYFIDSDIYYNVYLNGVGDIRFKNLDPTIKVTRVSQDLIKVFSKAELNNDRISSHVIAIKKILLLIGNYMDVNIVVPDMSVYLALTKYTGKMFTIVSTKKLIDSRIGGVSYTINRGS